MSSLFKKAIKRVLIIRQAKKMKRNNKKLKKTKYLGTTYQAPPPQIESKPLPHSAPIEKTIDEFWINYETEISPRPENLILREREKGLLNKKGENNCFLNVVIQSLYHLAPFRAAFLNQQEHFHESDETCVFCALKLIFIQYHYGEHHSVSPKGLREALSLIYSLDKRFQLGKSADAAEACDALFECLHKCLTQKKISPNQNEIEKNEDSNNCDPPCLVHQVFIMNKVQCIECKCKESSFLPFSETIHYVTAENLKMSRAFRVTADGNVEQSRSLGELILRSNIEERICKSCKGTTLLQYELQNSPPVITLGIVWRTCSPSSEEIKDIMRLINDNLSISSMFAKYYENMNYKLRGVISYYGHHYVAFFRNPQTKVWFSFDDKTVKQISRDWEDVVEKSILGKLQPMLLWYEQSS